MKLTALTLAASLLMTGCATRLAPTAEHDKLPDSARGDNDEGAKSALGRDFNAALALCDAEMLKMRESFMGSGNTELTLATVGILAGSIVVPALAAKTAAAKSAIAGWGGVSGAANAAQYTLQQKGASASSLGAVYEAVRKEVTDGTTAYSNATKSKDKVAAINKISVACRYPRLPNVEPVQPPTTPASGAGG